MYRGVTSLVLVRGIDPRDERAVTAVARSVQFSFPELDHVKAVNPPLLADGVDITATLRQPEVDANVSIVSSYSGVREAMVEQQRAIRNAHSVVMVGRDIGTVVAPDADVKIFLTASVEERAARRHSERIAAGRHETSEETLADLKRRDKLDSERELSPLRSADDAVRIDTTGLSADQALERIVTVVEERLAGAQP
ncbi:MAG: cytidylate kinase [Chloroflexi bacterium]|nr:cytidylate kinase [Chloroflexota bacterium]